MKSIALLFLFISSIAVGQKSYKEVISETIENYNYSKTDSLAKTIGYKGGENIKTNVNFKVNHKGGTFEISATGPHKIFIKESERIVKSIPKLEFDNKLKIRQHLCLIYL